MATQFLKYLLFIAILGTLCLSEWYLPILLRNNPSWQAKQLGGSYEVVAKPRFSPANWLKKRYQRDVEAHLKQFSENAPFFIRSRNQLNFDVFNDLEAKDILAGPNGNFHSIDYCMARTGYKCCDEPRLEGIADTLKQMEQWLNEQGKQLLVLLPPGKGRVLPNDMPEYFQQRLTEASNWQRMTDLLQEKGLPFMNFQFLIEQEAAQVHQFPLYPQFGLHWSHYGLTVASDSIRERIGQMLGKSLPVMNYQDAIVLKEKLIETDKELLNGANLFQEPMLKPMPYPQISYTKSDSTYRPDVLIIGDSFHKVIFEYGIQEALFAPNSSFWYYNRSIRPQGGQAGNKNLREAMESRDLIILQAAELNITSMGFGFMKNLMDLIDAQ